MGTAPRTPASGGGADTPTVVLGEDHRGFVWWAPERIAVIPMTARGEFSGAVALRVENGSPPAGHDCFDWRPLDREERALELPRDGEAVWVCRAYAEPVVIHRSVVIGSELWTLSAKGWDFGPRREHRLEAHDLAGLTHAASVDL